MQGLLVLLASIWWTQAAPDTVVVCPSAYRDALTSWIAHRSAQGHVVQLIDSDSDPAVVRAGIQRVANADRLHWLLLVGDAPPQHAAVDPHYAVPTFHLPAQVNVKFGSEAELASDLPYADLDNDGVPDLAVGRWTAKSADEVAILVRKTLAYEQQHTSHAWLRRIHFVAASGGFGPLADLTLETTARSIVAQCVPPAYETTLTYANWRSPYCPAPPNFRETALARHNEGCLFWVYMGHADREFVDVVQTPRGAHPILHRRDASRLAAAQGSPIALFLACYTAAFDSRSDCLAESMLLAEGGPVAVIGGSRVTMPYGMTVLGWEMLQELFQRRRATLGEVLLEAKRAAILSRRDDPQAKTIDALARLLNPAQPDLAAERIEQVQLFHLLGDPLLRIRYPKAVSVEAQRQVTPGTRLIVRGHSSVGGDASIELVVRRDRLPIKPPLRQRYDDSPESHAVCQVIYQQANDTRLSFQTRQLAAGPFQVELDVPGHATGPCHVRVLVDGPDGFALGSADVDVVVPKTP